AGAAGASEHGAAQDVARERIPVVDRARGRRVERRLTERGEIERERQPRAGMAIGPAERRVRRGGDGAPQRHHRQDHYPRHPSTLTVIATHAMIVSPTGTRSPPSTARTVTSPCGSSRFTAATS